MVKYFVCSFLAICFIMGIILAIFTGFILAHDSAMLVLGDAITKPAWGDINTLPPVEQVLYTITATFSFLFITAATLLVLAGVPAFALSKIDPTFFKETNSLNRTRTYPYE